MSEQEKDKVIQELLDSMGEEYLKGARAMLNQIREKVVCVKYGCGTCAVCKEGINFMEREGKKLEEFKGIDKDKILNLIREKEVEITIREKEKTALQNEINNLKEKLPKRSQLTESKEKKQ